MNPANISEMPLAERLKMMEALWSSLCEDGSEQLPVPDWHREVLNERLARLANGSEPIYSWSDAKQRIRVQTKIR